MNGEAVESRKGQMNQPVGDPGRIAIFSVLLAIIGRGLGYVRTLIVAYFFGVTPIMDAFAASMGIIELFTSTMRSSLQMALLPQLAAAEHYGGLDESRSLMGFSSRLVAALSGIFLLSIIFSPKQIVKVFAYGFTGQVLGMSAEMLRLLSVYLFGYTGYNLYSIWAFNRKRYLLPSVLEAMLNILTVSFFLLILPLSRSTALALSIGLAWCILFLAMILLQRDFPLAENRYIPHHVKPLTKNFVFCLGLVGSGALYQATDRFFASLLKSGSVAVINYSIFLLWVPVALLEPAFQILYADLVHLYHAEPKRACERMLDALSLALFYGIPMSLFFLIFSPSAVQVFFGYGAFDNTAVGLTAACLSAYGAGFAFTAMNHLLWRYGQASGRSGELVLIAYFSVFINAVLDWVLSRSFGVVGIALATTIVTSILLLLFIWRFMGKVYFSLVFKRGVLFLVLGAPWYFIAGLIHISSPSLRLLLGIGTSIVTVFFADYWLRHKGIKLEGTPTSLVKVFKRK